MPRIGQGWDRHCLVKGRRCVLGGVDFPDCEVGPRGHSDGDAVCHAVCDALLGAAALGDLGAHFPDDDERWKDADSIHLLMTVAERVAEAGWRVVNVDTTVIAERPRLAPRVSSMRHALADALSIDVGAVSVKATRGEGLGPEGRGECVTAMAVVMVEEAVEES